MSSMWYRAAVAPLLLLGAMEVGCGGNDNNNEAPRLSKESSAAATAVTAGSPVQLSVEATDAEGDTLSYAWTQVPAEPAGTFSDAASASPTWTAPQVSAATHFTLRVVVSDGKGGTVQSEVGVEARPPAAVNTAPVLADPSPSATSVRAGDEVTLSASATDVDSDTLSYTWTQATPAAQGTFSAGQATAQAKWYSPAVSADTDFTFNVKVSDGRGGEATKPVTVRVTVPKFAADIQPVFSVCTGCHKATAPSAGLSLVDSATSYANLVNVQAKSACSVSMLRVKPSDPANSALWHKVAGTDCGTRMPKSNLTYFDSRPGELVRLRSWILAGANND